MLLAEDVLLLLTDDASGKSVIDNTRVELALAGGVLLDLVLAGRVDVAGPGEPVKPGRLVVRDATPMGDVVLDAALRRIAEGHPTKPANVLPKIAKGLREELLRRLTARGILRFEEGRVLGIFPTRAWPAVDSAHEKQLRGTLFDVLVVGRSPAPRDAAVIALLQAVDAVPKVLRGTTLSSRELRGRAKQIAAGDLVGDAVRKAVEQIAAATAAAVMVATSAATMSAGS